MQAEYDRLNQSIQKYAHIDLERGKNWYSPTANAYTETRPHYPVELIDYVIRATHLSSISTILETGCDPGTATTSILHAGNPHYLSGAQSEFLSTGSKKLHVLSSDGNS